ncbi:hypothetical protein, partial [uncultured Parabacteroides sp.]|uniref:hypothetical protein n=1 Tax=uncultured Parabacteroides sp. TaxID=512312 RepID=UPI0026599766
SLSRLKLASLKQQTLRTLTAVSALNAHQLRPEVEPGGSLGIADTGSSFSGDMKALLQAIRSISY